MGPPLTGSDLPVIAASADEIAEIVSASKRPVCEDDTGLFF